MSEVLYCRGPGKDGDPGDCGREVCGHGEEVCSTHMKQLQRTGKMVPIAEKVSAKEHLLNLWDTYAQADGDREAETAERAFWTQAKAILKVSPDDEDVAALVRKARSEATRRGMAAAKARGKHIGRPIKSSDPAGAHAGAHQLLKLGKMELVARLLGIGRATLYRRLKMDPSETRTQRTTRPRPTPESI